MQTAPPLPAPPETPEAPEKNGFKLRWYHVAIAVLALAFVGTLIDSNGTANPTASTSGDVACVDQSQVASLLTDAQSELTLAGSSATGFELDTAATHTDAASDDLYQVAALFSDYPDVANDAAMAANYLSDAGDDLRAFDLDGATSSLQGATNYIDKATTDSGTASPPDC